MPAQLPPPTQPPGGDHPLAPILRDAIAGGWPPADGAVVHLPAWRAGVSGIVALTGRAYLCTDRSLDLDALTRAGADGFGGATLPQAVLDIAGPGAVIDCLDVLLAGQGRGRVGRLVDRPDLRDSPRAAAARRSRSHVRVLGYADTHRSDLVTLSRGVAGLPELGVEAAEPGRGSTLFGDALDSLSEGQLLLAGVAPGNARSLRSALGAGVVIIGSVQIIVHTAPLPDERTL